MFVKIKLYCTIPVGSLTILPDIVPQKVKRKHYCTVFEGFMSTDVCTFISYLYDSVKLHWNTEPAVMLSFHESDRP